jgi:glycerol uptake facilitator-like aquaporin
VQAAPDSPPPGARAIAAEALGTALLVAAVVGSGIHAQRLSPGDVGLQLLENTLATVAALLALVLLFAPVSGAHFNPVVSWASGARPGTAAALTVAQVGGGAAGALLANAMFGLPLLQASTRERTGAGLWLSEVVATFGLVLIAVGMPRGPNARTPVAVAAWIGGAYWFTASTSFANPAVTVARSLSDTFAGIAPSSVPGFVAAQVVGGVLGAVTARLLLRADAGSPR